MVKLFNKMDNGVHGDNPVNLTQNPAVRKWMDSIGENSRQTSLWHFETFMKWVRANGGKFSAMSPDDMVEYVLDASRRDLNDLLDVKKAYLHSMTGSVGHKRNADKSVNSFFRHNRAPLPKDTTLNLSSDDGHPKVNGTLTAEEIKRVVLASDKMYQAVFLTMLGGGFGKSEFIEWSNTGMEELEDQLNGDLVKVSLTGRKGMKNQYNYFTYVGGDALAALKRYIRQVRPQRAAQATKRGESSTAIFLNQWGNPLTKEALFWYWMRKTKRLGIVEPDRHRRKVPRYGKNLHEIRDVYRTLWRKSGVPVEYGEFFMGHEGAFDDYGYDKTYKDEHDMRAKYKAALPWLCLITRNEAFDLVNKAEYENTKIMELQGTVDNLSKALSQVMERLEQQEKGRHE